MNSTLATRKICIQQITKISAVVHGLMSREHMYDDESAGLYKLSEDFVAKTFEF